MADDRLWLIEEDLDNLYYLGDQVEKYLALFASFEEWCKQQSDGDASLD